MIDLVDTTAGTCGLPDGFVSRPMPLVAPLERLLSHNETIVINRPLVRVDAVEDATKLEEAIFKSGALPYVIGTHALEGAGHRLVCLSDKSTLQEQEVEVFRDGQTSRFRYVVWNYTSRHARAVEYATGHFVRTDLGNGRTFVSWTYAFKLRTDRFPGALGPLGNCLFRVFFLDGPYARMMKGTLRQTKMSVESQSISGAQP